MAVHLIDVLRSHVLSLPDLAKFAIVIGAMVGVPPLARRARIPEMVGLLLLGVILGPHVLEFFGEDHPVATFFAELGKLLLMFSAGLEIDLAQFRKVQNRSMIFGIGTTMIPLLLGTLYGLVFGYSLIPAIVIGSLLASHTLLSLSIVTQLGAIQLEPVIVTIGATVVSDTLSLIVFAICVSTYTTGFSPSGLALQIVEIATFVPLILMGVSRAGSFILNRVHGSEEAVFITLLGIMAVSGTLSALINLPGIVGAFLAGLSVNAAVQDHPAREKLGFFGKALFIPSFFIVTGFLIAPGPFVRSFIDNFALVAGIVLTLLVGKGVAAEVAGRAFGYMRGARLTVWALTLPQVAATLAATLVAYGTTNAAGERMLDGRMLNAVLVLLVVTSVLGPVLTERFTPRMLDEQARARRERGG
ncbi:MAG TPA: cation:proton antiporter [Rhodopila sp.]|nr:cation:proton antiporter [Rhodopila sp.]